MTLNPNLKKGIYFDLNIKSLQHFYPKSNWHQAYSDIRNYLESHNFEHVQGSGYHSRTPMSEAAAMVIIFSMYEIFFWLDSCTSICIISDIPTVYDVSILFTLQGENI